ncbi:hypothetical protein SARC_01086, partial [Sphaeroforma arctica JP610]
TRCQIEKRFYKPKRNKVKFIKSIPRPESDVPKEFKMRSAEGEVLLYSTERPNIFRGLSVVLVSTGFFCSYLTYLSLDLRENDNTNVMWYLYDWRHKLFGGETKYDDIEDQMPMTNPLHVEMEAANIEAAQSETNPKQMESDTKEPSTVNDNADAEEEPNAVDTLSTQDLQELVALDQAMRNESGELIPYWQRAMIASFFVGVQVIVTGLAVVIPKRTVASLTLAKGGAEVMVERFSVLGGNTVITAPVSKVQALRARTERQGAGQYMPVRIETSYINYLVDMGGNVYNRGLFNQLLKM